MHWLRRLLGLLCLLGCLGSGAWGHSIGGPATAGGSSVGEVPAPPPGPNVRTIAGVPSYIWYYGCGPTSGAMILGYWDARGFGNFIPGSNDWNTNTQAIRDVIASAGHIRDYAPTPDRTPTAGDPYHADDCLADFMDCSRTPRAYGWSYYSDQDDGLEDYAEYVGYVGSDAYNRPYSSLWTSFVAEIDADRPVEFLVDTDGNNSTDHFIAVIGYDSTPGDLKYACLDTWDHDVHWFEYAGMAGGQPWGVYGGTIFHPAPEPGCLLLLAAAGPLLRRRRRRAG